MSLARRKVAMKDGQVKDHDDIEVRKEATA
jgi:hypothetical protein